MWILCVEVVHMAFLRQNVSYKKMAVKKSKIFKIKRMVYNESRNWGAKFNGVSCPWCYSQKNWREENMNAQVTFNPVATCYTETADAVWCHTLFTKHCLAYSWYEIFHNYIHTVSYDWITINIPKCCALIKTTYIYVWLMLLH